MNLAGFGSFLAPAELAEQQVVGGHDGGRSVGGEYVYDFREGVALRLCHVRQHRRVEILGTQPEKRNDSWMEPVTVTSAKSETERKFRGH